MVLMMCYKYDDNTLSTFKYLSKLYLLISRRSLLLSLSGGLGSGGSILRSNGGLVLLGNGHSLSFFGELVEHVTALSTGVSVGVISHIST